MSIDDPNSPLSRRVIYFEYDSSNILAEDQELLTAHAAYLVANPGQTVTLDSIAGNELDFSQRTTNAQGQATTSTATARTTFWSAAAS